MVDFGKALFKALDQAAPPSIKLRRTVNAEATVFWRATADTSRPDLVPLEPSQVAEIQDAHAAYLEQAHRLRLPYKPGSRGIVSTASGASMPVFMVSIRMLRRTGCTLPVEIFVDEHDPYICDELLPTLNARCMTLSTYLGPNISRLNKYQFKIFAMLFSSFEDLLFLDADNLLITDPTPAFTSPPFNTTGLISWQDFWASSASPHLYTIQNLPIPPMNTLASTESGQLLISKNTHSTTLLLSTYYNLYGPSLYYELMSQGGPGEGDKETFLAAATALHLPYHQVRKSVDTIGYHDENVTPARYHGVAMLQYDPTQDMETETTSSPRPWALHHNYPKPDPVTLFADPDASDPSIGAALNKGSVGSRYHRLWGDKQRTIERFGKDFESEMWEEIEFIACEMGDRFWPYWESQPEGDGVKGSCEEVRRYREAIFGGGG